VTQELEMTTVRLDVKSEADLKRLSARRGQTKSEVIRDAIARLAEEESEQPSAYERLRPFIGIVDEGDPRLSEDTGKRFREILESRQGARRSG
jgi:predicted DNA-binding protein